MRHYHDTNKNEKLPFYWYGQVKADQQIMKNEKILEKGRRKERKSMKTVENMLRKELEFLRGVAEETTLKLKKAPKGNIRVRKWKGCVEFYCWDETERKSGKHGYNGRYLRKTEEETARAIIQRDYDMQVKKRGEKLVKQIEKYLKSYAQNDLKQLYQEMNPLRRNLIEPVVLSDEEYIKQWQAVEYEGKRFADEEIEIITERGERVRSKSEKIIADKLYMLGIPYRYEYPVMFPGNIRIYPDFTILKMPERKEVYLEHFGMMDDAEYVGNVMYKLDTYEKNGIYPGEGLFFTHETGKSPLNTRTLDKMLKAWFC